MKAFAFLSALFLAFSLRGADLIENGGFENGSKGWHWEDWKGKKEPGELERSKVFSGSYSYKMGLSGDADNLLYCKASLPERGKACKLSVKLKGEGLKDGDVRIRLLPFAPDEGGKGKPLNWIMNPPGSGVVDLISAGGTFDWTSFEAIIPAASFPQEAANMLLFVMRANNGEGLLFVDDVKLESVEQSEAAAAPPKAMASGGSVAQLPAPAKNLLPGDSSFETGTAGWQGERDGSKAFHGEFSLKIPASSRGVSSGFYFKAVKEGKPYVLSVYACSSSPAKVALNATGHDYRWLGNKEFEIGPSWSRLAIQIPPQKSSVTVTVKVSKPEGVDVWLDAAQLEEGSSLSAYAPSETLSAGISRTSEPGDIVLKGGSPLSLELRCRNNGARALPLKIQVDSVRYDGVRCGGLARSAELAPGSSLAIPFEALKSRERGYYVARALVEAQGMSKVEAIRPFAVVDAPAPSSPDSFFGIHPFGQAPLEAQRRIGASWVRNFRMWKYTQSKDGAYVVPDSWWRPYIEAGMPLMETVKVTEAPASAFLSDGSLKFDGYCEYLRQLLASYGSQARAWEIENEPDLTFPGQFKMSCKDAAEYYAKLVALASAEIKKARPDAIVMAGGVSGCDFNDKYPFLKTVLEKAGSSVDVVPVHPYAHARYIGPEASDIGPDLNGGYEKLLALRDLIKSCGGSQEIWLGEIGWALDVFEDPLSPAAIRHADYLVRMMLLGKSAGAKRVMYFLADACMEKERYYYGLWRNGDPLPAAAAYSAVAQLLEGASAGPEIMGSNVRAYAYSDSKGRPFAAIWLEKGRPSKAVFKAKPGALEARDMFNNPAGIQSTDGFELSISGSPCYLIPRDGMDMDSLCSLVRSADFQLPPADCQWRILGDKEIQLSLRNLRRLEVKGEISVAGEGAELLEPSRSFSLKPDGEAVLKFQLASGSLAGKRLKAEASSSSGAFSSEFAVALSPCPFRKSGSLRDGAPLIELKSRTTLMPPDSDWKGPEDLSVKAWISWDEGFLNIVVDATDDVHCQPFFPGRLWAADSIQIAIDSLADAKKDSYGYEKGCYELSVALAKDGPAAECTYLYEGGLKDAFLKSLRFDVSRYEGVKSTLYKVSIPWASLNLKPKPGMVFGLNFIVNDDDGHGRKHWQGVTPGIGEMKYPYAFRKFILEN